MTFELGGATGIPYVSKSPKGVGEFRTEMGNQLPDVVYRVFEKAVNYHIKKNYAAAKRYYGHIRVLKLENGESYSLLEHSKVFKYNWRLVLIDLER